MRNRRLSIAIAAILAGLGLDAGGAVAATNLVANGGFETGDFTGWTENGWTVATSIPSVSGPLNPFSGSYFAAESCSAEPCTLSQTIATTPGARYNLSFETSPGYGTYGVYVKWGDQVLFSFGGGYGTFWEPLGATNILATSSSMTISFLEYLSANGTSAMGLDDITVTAVVPEPATWAMLGLGFGGLVLIGRGLRKRAAFAG